MRTGRSQLGIRVCCAGVLPSFVCVLFLASAASADELRKPETGNKIKVFILAGQSNMEGRADGAKLTPVDRERLELAQERVQLAFNYEPIRALDVVKPTQEIAEIYERNLIFGPELFLGFRYQKRGQKKTYFSLS